MRLDEAKKRLEHPEAMDKLSAALQDGAPLPNPKILPLDRLDEARINYAGVIGRIQGKSWRGLRWVAQYGQDTGPLEKRFQYTFEGISNDKRYFIVYITHVEYPDVPEALLKGPKDPGRRPDGKFDEKLSDKAWREYGDKVDAFLKTVKPERLNPSLLKLDAALRAIELR